MATPQEIQMQMLISALSSMGGGVNPNLMLSAYPGKVSPAGVKSAFDPEILFSSGLVTPDIINQLTLSQLSGLQSKYSSDLESRLPYEASDMVFAPYVTKYGGNDIVSAFMREAFDKISTGVETPDTIIARIGQSDKTPQEVKDALGVITVDLDSYGETVARRNDALSKFQYDQQGKLDTLGPAPTVQDARMAMFKDMGVPQLGLLGDPNATYQFNGADFVDKERLAAAQGPLAEALRNQGVVRGQSAPSVDAQKKLEQAYIMRGIEEQARKFSETSTAGMRTKTDWLDDVNQVLAETAKGGAFGAAVLGAPSIGIGAPIGLGIGLAAGAAKGAWDWLSGNDDEPLKEEKKKAMAAAYEAERKRLIDALPSYNDEAARVKYSPEYRNAVAQTNRAQAGVSQENAYGRIVAETIARRLAEAGKTPFQQNLNDLLGYAVRTAR